jgi:excisionase family DNA binding protein
MNVLKVKEVAEQLRVSQNTIYRLVRDGVLRGVRIGGSIRIRSADVERRLRPEPKVSLFR